MPKPTKETVDLLFGIQDHVTEDIREAISLVRASLNKIESDLDQPQGQPELERDRLQSRISRLEALLGVRQYLLVELVQVDPLTDKSSSSSKPWHSRS